MAGYPVITQANLTEIPVVDNTWLDVSSYVGKQVLFTPGGGNAYVEFSNDGVNPIPNIQSMNLNPSSWGNGRVTEWSTNFPAKYIRFPSLESFSVTPKLYGSATPIERKTCSIVKEESITLSSGTPVVIGEDLAHDPFVQHVRVDADPNGVQAVVQVEYAGKRASGTIWAMHSAASLLGTGSTLASINFIGVNADNAVILAPSQRVCTMFKKVAIYCTAGTVDVDIRSQQFGTWNAAVALRKQSDNTLVTQLVAGEVGILENVAFESMQVLQKGATASNANVIFFDPIQPAEPFFDLGAWAGAVVVTSYSSSIAVVTLYLHSFY